MSLRVTVVVGVVLSACATTKSATVEETASADAKPDAGVAAPAPEPKKPTAEELARQVEEMFARERDAAGVQTVTFEGKTIELEASGPVEIVRNEDLRQSAFLFPIGTQEKAQCFVYDQMVPVGALLGRFTDALRTKVDIKAVRTTAIDVVEKEPLVFADIAYVAPTPKGNVIGQLKLGVYPSPQAPMACLLDEPGYVQTFRRVVTKAATGLAKARVPGEAAAYRSVYVTSIRGAPVGFERSVYVKAKDGSRTASTTSVMIVPRTQSDWMLQDSTSTQQIAKDGYLNQRTAKMLANGEEQLDITLKRDKAGYAYSGRASQKELTGSFKTKDKKGLAADPVIVKSVKTLLMAGKKPVLEFEQYMPDADPTAPLTVTVKRDEAAGADAIVMETAKLKLNARVDAAGDLTKVEVPMGPITLVQERVFVEGTPE